MKKIFAKSLFRLAFFLLISLSCFSVARSQSPNPISVPTHVGSAFSPSIAAFNNGGTRTLVAAYTYVKTGGTRTVGISTSTDAGSTWPSPSTLVFPSFGGTTALNNMDEAQLVWCGGNKLVLVVRAWDGTSEEGVKGVQEQSKSVYTKVGIYQCVSTDAGATWGVVSGGSLTAGSWQKCEESNASHTTLESPHIAFRVNYGIYAYPYLEGTPSSQPYGHIVWTKKVFSWNTGANKYDDVTTCTIGHQIFPTWDAANFGNIFSPVAYGNDYPTLSGTSKTFGSGPERASIAISPNGDIWLGYYGCNYNSFNNLSPGAVAHFFVVNLTASSGWSTSSGLDLNSGGSVTLPGTPDNQRGYVYAEEFTDITTNDKTWDLAQGPSIEVACKDAQFNCNPDYQIGLAFTTVSSFANQRRKISVKLANCTWGNGASTLSFSDVSPSQSDDNMRYFPVLKHAEATDNLLTYKVKEGVASGFNPSYFILSYMIGTTVSPNNTFDGVSGRTAFSFDNSSFNDGAASPLPTDITSDGTTHTGCLKNNDCFGNKIDIAGFVGDLSLYPAWHRCKNGGVAEDIVTVEGSAFIIKPYLQGMPGNDAAAYPMTGEITVGSAWNIYEKFWFGLSSPTATASHTSITPSVSGPGSATFGTWNWDAASPYIQPSGISSVKGGLFYGVFVPHTTTQGFLNFSDQRKAVTAGNVTFAVSESEGSVLLNQSMGRSHSAGLFDAINWTQNIQIESVGAGITQSNPSIGVYQQGQAENYVTVYDGSSFTGQGAIAVVWTEKQSVTPCVTGTTGTLVKIKMRMNEFNASSGSWNWSPVYTIISYYHRDPSVTGELADKTTAVVAPIVTPPNNHITIPTGYTAAPHSDESTKQPWPGMPCNLLGWSITWTGPQLTTGGTCHLGFDAECTQGVTGNHNMINTGLYSRNWMRLDGSDNQITGNTNWGVFRTLPSGAPQPQLVPTAANLAFNDLLENIFLAAKNKAFSQQYQGAGGNPGGIETIGHVIEFPSITSSENKWRWWDDANNDNYREEISFSTDGQVDGGGSGVRIWHTAAKYQRQPPTTPHVYGELIDQQGHLELQPTTVTDNEQDRNPSITINSSGQVFVAWESMVRSTNDLDAGNGNKGFWYSQIQIQNTPITAPTSFGVGNVTFILQRKIISGGVGFSNAAPTAQWSNWLRNPSLTGFPKTRSMNCLFGESNDSYLDEDFACVQLLYWNAQDSRIRARHYFELQQDALDNGTAGHLYTDLYGRRTAPTNEGIPAQQPTGTLALEKGGDFPISDNGNRTLDGTLNDAYSTLNKGNTQLSHSPRQHSPRWWPGQSGVPSTKSNCIDASASSALELTNTVSGGILTANFFNYRFDAYKTAAPEKLANEDVEYRSEYADDGFSVHEFKFGGIKVGNENEMRNVAAAYAHDPPESASYRTTRDRVLSTNTFDWNSGEELTYQRMLGSFPAHEENVNSFKKTNSAVSYEVDLVKENGSIIPLEILTGMKDGMNGADSKRAHIVNSGKSLKNVFLICKNLSDPTGASDYKHTLNIIYKEDGPYDLLRDTTMNFSGTVLSAFASDEKGISNMYPNPIGENDRQISFFMNEPQSANVNVNIYDVLGRAVLDPLTFSATGNWQHVTLDAPQTQGAYIVKIQIGNEVKTYPLRVVR